MVLYCAKRQIFGPEFARDTGSLRLCKHIPWYSMTLREVKCNRGDLRYRSNPPQVLFKRHSRFFEIPGGSTDGQSYDATLRTRIFILHENLHATRV